MVGPVIDEVSVWSENVDWIGVIFAPSVKFELMSKNIDPNDLNFVRNYSEIPFKDSVKGLVWCVKWGENDVRNISSFMNSQAYVSYDVTKKYLNTIRFLESTGLKKDDVNMFGSGIPHQNMQNEFEILKTEDRRTKQKPVNKTTNPTLSPESYTLKNRGTLIFRSIVSPQNPVTNSNFRARMFPLMSVQIAEIWDQMVVLIFSTVSEDETIVSDKFMNIVVSGNSSYEFFGLTIHVIEIYEGLEGKLVELRSSGDYNPILD